MSTGIEVGRTGGWDERVIGGAWFRFEPFVFGRGTGKVLPIRCKKDRKNGYPITNKEFPITIVTLSRAKSPRHAKAVLHCGGFFVVSLLRMTK